MVHGRISRGYGIMEEKVKRRTLLSTDAGMLVLGRMVRARAPSQRTMPNDGLVR